MSLYDIGDLIFNEMCTQGRLVADGSRIDAAAYPYLASLAGDETNREYGWDQLSGLPTIGGTKYDATFSPDGLHLVVISSTSPSLYVLSTADWSIVTGTPTIANARKAFFSPDGRYLALTLASSPFLSVIDTQDWSIVSGGPSLGAAANYVSFSPDGQLMAVSHNRVGTSGSNYYGLSVYNVGGWDRLTNVTRVGTSPGGAASCSFSSDGRYLAVSYSITPFYDVLDTNGWGLVSGLPSVTSQGHVAFSPDGVFLVAGNRIVSMEDWSITTTISPGLFDISFDIDNRRLAGRSQTATTTCVVFNIDDWTSTTVPLGANQEVNFSFSPDGRYYAAVWSSTGPRVYVTFEDLPTGYKKLPNIPVNHVVPGLPVLVQAEKEE